MGNVPSPFKFNGLNAFCAFTLMMVWGTLFGPAAFFLAFMVSLMFFPVIEERKK